MIRFASMRTLLRPQTVTMVRHSVARRCAIRAAASSNPSSRIAAYHSTPAVAAEASSGQDQGPSKTARFWQKVTVRESNEDVSLASRRSVPGDGSGSWEVLIDNRVLRTPKRETMRVPTRGLALSLAGEWAQQEKYIQPSQMPLTTLVVTTIDNTALNREATVDELMRYLRGDTVCYYADESEWDGDLVELQREVYEPIHNWFKQRYDRDLAVTDTMISPAHPEDTVATVRAVLEGLEPLELTAVHSVTTACKSLVLALALLERYLTVEEVIASARVDEEHQIEQWGLVEGGHDVDRAHINVKVAAASVLWWHLEEDE